MSRILEISDPKPRPIRSNLTLGLRGEHHTTAFLEASTSKSNSTTQDATMMNMMHKVTNVGIKTYPAYLANLDAQPAVPGDLCLLGQSRLICPG